MKILQLNPGLAGKAWKQVLLSLPRVFISTPQVGDGGDGAMILGTNWPRHHTSLFLGAQSYSRYAAQMVGLRDGGIYMWGN